jgi:ligand-binding SRPBCC domain-containing protein
LSTDNDTHNRTFEHRSLIRTTVERMTAFHAQPRAFNTLTPPPLIIQVLRDDRRSLTDGEIDFRLWFGPLPVRWLALHQPLPSEAGFMDVMLRGPLASWQHQHIFRQAETGVELVDHIVFQHKSGLWGLFTRLFFDGLPLRMLFVYRHFRTRRALAK